MSVNEALEVTVTFLPLVAIALAGLVRWRRYPSVRHQTLTVTVIVASVYGILISLWIIPRLR